MSLINFGAGNSQQGVFSRIKPYPTPNIQGLLPNGAIPVVRSGNKNYFVVVTTGGSDPNMGRYVNLFTTNPTALVTNIDMDAVTAGGRFLSLCISSIDQCMYALLRGTDTLIRLVKISDTTGAVTQIGSGFTPTTPANWQMINGTLEDVAGVIRYRCLGKYQDIDKTTGAAITEDTSFSLTNYLDVDTNYISLDGTIVSGLMFYLSTASSYNLWTPVTSHASTGMIDRKHVSGEVVFGSHVVNTSTTWRYSAVMIDNDKMAFTYILSGGDAPVAVTTRTSYDAFLQSIVNYAAGL